MKYLAITILVLMSVVANATVRERWTQFYLVETQSLHDGFEASNIPKHSVVSVRCYDPGTKRASCHETIKTENNLVLTVHDGNETFCQVESNGKVILFTDFKNESNPKKINNGVYQCLKIDHVGQL